MKLELESVKSVFELMTEQVSCPGWQERVQRKDELRSQVDEGPVVKAYRAPSAPSMDESEGAVPNNEEWDDHLAAGHAQCRGWCMLLRGWRRGQCVNDHGREVLDGSLDGHLLRVERGCTTAMLDCWQATCEQCDHERQDVDHGFECFRDGIALR